jgi:predicted  nucleic acid-binding Zn-ribbon protein
MDEILDRINLAEKQISTVKNKVAYRDLRKMLTSVDKIVTAMSQESVECRQLKKVTRRYTELEQQARDLLSNLEKHITFAALLG